MLRWSFGIVGIMFFTSANADTWADYTLMTNKLAGMTNLTPSYWAWDPQGNNTYDLYSDWQEQWPHPYHEVYKVQDFNECPVRLVRLLGNYNYYGSAIKFYQYRMQKEEYVAPDGTYDVTSYCGSGGQHYALFDVQQHTYVLKSWGQILVDNKLVANFYHEQRVSPPQSVYNPAWAGDTIRTVPAIKQEEKFWQQTFDVNGAQTFKGWVLGSGPVDAQGKPTGAAGGYYGRVNYHGKGKGLLWKVDEINSQGGTTTRYLYDTWIWQ
ncbi:MAG TPA: hypothetical protein VNN09_03705 [Candidatus Competibacteraceae bacterium]|nr:hypothetical protein [Candidatus Competibacteraceae bacterium]